MSDEEAELASWEAWAPCRNYQTARHAHAAGFRAGLARANPQPAPEPDPRRVPASEVKAEVLADLRHPEPDPQPAQRKFNPFAAVGWCEAELTQWFAASVDPEAIKAAFKKAGARALEHPPTYDLTRPNAGNGLVDAAVARVVEAARRAARFSNAQDAMRAFASELEKPQG